MLEWIRTQWRKEWPEMKDAPFAFIICSLVGVGLGVLIMTLAFEHLVIPAKDAHINLLQDETNKLVREKENQPKIDNQNDPYEQHLFTGTATIVVKTEPNAAIKKLLPEGYLLFVKNKEIILRMDLSIDKVFERMENNQQIYKAAFELDQTSKAVDNPINQLAQNDFIQIYLNAIQPQSKIEDGNVLFIFNSSVPPIRMLIPPQTMDGNVIFISDIQQYFKKEKKL